MLCLSTCLCVFKRWCVHVFVYSKYKNVIKKRQVDWSNYRSARRERFKYTVCELHRASSWGFVVSLRLQMGAACVSAYAKNLF